jgi:guanylate kinase
MKQLIVFIGDGGSGKTTLIDTLSERYPEYFKKIVTCTNRDPRIGEIDGKDYHFLPPDYFSNNPDLVLTKKTNDGIHYGTRMSDLRSDTHHLLLASKPTGIQRLLDLGLKNIVVVRISITEELKVKRMKDRGDSEDSIKKRVLSDNQSKRDVDLGMVSVIDISADQELNEKINIIKKYVMD